MIIEVTHEKRLKKYKYDISLNFIKKLYPSSSIPSVSIHILGLHVVELVNRLYLDERGAYGSAGGVGIRLSNVIGKVLPTKVFVARVAART